MKLILAILFIICGFNTVGADDPELKGHLLIQEERNNLEQQCPCVLLYPNDMWFSVSKEIRHERDPSYFKYEVAHVFKDNGPKIISIENGTTYRYSLYDPISHTIILMDTFAFDCSNVNMVDVR